NRAEVPAGGEAQSSPGFWRVPLLFGIVGAYVFLLPVLGYRLATVLFVLALMPAIEWPTSVRAWATVISISIATSLVSHLVFGRYLLVLLPRGSLTGWEDARATRQCTAEHHAVEVSASAVSGHLDGGNRRRNTRRYHHPHSYHPPAVH